MHEFIDREHGIRVGASGHANYGDSPSRPRAKGLRPGTPSAANRERGLSAALTQREHSVIEGLAQGHANKEIAVTLGCSVRTVEYHVKNILHKYGVDTRTRLLAHLLSRL